MPRIRTTLTIDSEVIERFQAIAAVQGESLSSSVSNWLKHSVDSAELVASELHRIRSASSPVKASAEVVETLRVIRERYANLLFRVNGEDRSPSRGDALALPGTAADRHPPLGNTGGKGKKSSPKKSPPSSDSSSGLVA